MDDIDPLSAHLAEVDETGAASIDLDQFVTRVGASSPADIPAGRGPEEAPVVSYDDGDVLPIVLPLYFRPSVDGVRLASLSVYPPEQADIDAWGAGEISNRDLLARMARVHPAVIAHLKWPDAERLHQVFSILAPHFVTGE
ncbi:hypothetical protein ACU5AY_05925 [Rhizobium sp. PAMB 3174]